MINHEACHSGPSSLEPLELLTDRVLDINKLDSHDALGPAARSTPYNPGLSYQVNRCEGPLPPNPTDFRCVGSIHRSDALHMPRSR